MAEIEVGDVEEEYYSEFVSIEGARGKVLLFNNDPERDAEATLVLAKELGAVLDS